MNTKGKVVIVECYSSAVNYIHDVYERGFVPVLLELYAHEEEQEKIRKINDIVYGFNGDPCPQVIMAGVSYEETLGMMKKLGPVLILPGSDLGLELSVRLSTDMGLKTNPLSSFWKLRDKLSTQESLREAGLRCIKGSVASTEDEAVGFFRLQQGKKIVLKPSQNAGSVGVFICKTEDEVKNAYQINKELLESRKRKNEKIIVQEYIDGEEYAVDTISCNGRHTALFAMKYIKRLCAGFGKIYDTDIYISPDNDELTEVVDYCFSVLSCLGVCYGPVHSEFMIDENGPVLIEVNARPAGAFQKYTFQDKVMKNHETAVALDSYLLDQEKFLEMYPERMHLNQYAVVKQLCLDEDIYVEKVKLTERLSALESFDYAIENGEQCVYLRTTDLYTNGGMIYLTSANKLSVEADLKKINELEKEGLDELFDWHRT